MTNTTIQFMNRGEDEHNPSEFAKGSGRLESLSIIEESPSGSRRSTMAKKKNLAIDIPKDEFEKEKLL